MKRLTGAGLVLSATVLFAACQKNYDSDSTVRFAGRKGTPQPGVSQVAPGVRGEPVAGQSIFVPAYGSVSIGEKAGRFGLGITLSVRNSDRKESIVVESVDYRDAGGQIVRRFVEAPLRIAPMAVFEIFVGEKDVVGGAASSFLVEWTADRAVSAPIAETVMIGTAGTQGISFTSRGVVISERGIPGG